MSARSRPIAGHNSQRTRCRRSWSSRTSCRALRPARFNDSSFRRGLMTTPANLPLGPRVLELDYDREIERVCARLQGDPLARPVAPRVGGRDVRRHRQLRVGGAECARAGRRARLRPVVARTRFVRRQRARAGGCWPSTSGSVTSCSTSRRRSRPSAAIAGATRRSGSVFPEYGDGWKNKIVISGGLEGRVNHFQLVVQTPSGETRQARLGLKEYLQIVAATNFKQRIRKTVEYFHADRLNYAVVGTPNRLEYDQGFFVKNGDGSADVKPIAHLYKSQVYALARHMGLPDEICGATPTTDTYSLPQGQDEFYFALPYAQMDIALWALNHGRPGRRAGRGARHHRGAGAARLQRHRGEATHHALPALQGSAGRARRANSRSDAGRWALRREVTGPVEILFWLSLFAVAYPYAIYPALLVGWNRLAGRRLPEPDPAHRPSVTVILPVHNEARRIEAKIANLLALDYPMDLLQLIVIGDGCTDDTLERAATAGGRASSASPAAGPCRQGRGPQCGARAGHGRDRRLHRCRHPARSRGAGEPRGSLQGSRGGLRVRRGLRGGGRLRGALRPPGAARAPGGSPTALDRRGQRLLLRHAAGAVPTVPARHGAGFPLGARHGALWSPRRVRARGARRHDGHHEPAGGVLAQGAHVPAGADGAVWQCRAAEPSALSGLRVHPVVAQADAVARAGVAGVVSRVGLRAAGTSPCMP